MTNSPSPWRPAIIGIIALALSQPLFLLLVWSLRIPSVAVQNTNELGGIMAAIFTAGGLIVAIVSIYTMANIQAVSRRAVQPLLQEIPAQISASIQRFSTAYSIYLGAQSLIPERGYKTFDYSDIADAEIAIEQAIGIDSTITGTREWMGMVYHRAARLKFLEGSSLPLSRMPTDHYLPSSSVASLASRGIRWIESALGEQNSENRLLPARLAELHALLPSPLTDVLKCVEKANGQADHPLPNGDEGLAIMLNACQSDDAVSALVTSLGVSLPSDEDIIASLAERIERQGGSTGPLMLLALQRFDQYLKDEPRRPCILLLYHNGNTETAFAQWQPMVQYSGHPVRRATHPPSPPSDASGSSPNPGQVPIAELLQQLRAMFHLIGVWGELASDWE